ncbi:MAG TPA: hypothetical protein G4O03_08780 [Dehalococcoidia bacterium]|nr:hypothetical protein [Dehalococcoidia bacterium]
MSRKWNLLPFGTKIRIKGEKVERTIFEYLPSERNEIIGYITKTQEGELMPITFDIEIKIVGM